MNAELEENKELAQNRHCELEKLRQDFDEVTTQNEKLKVGDTPLMGSKRNRFCWPTLVHTCESSEFMREIGMLIYFLIYLLKYLYP